MWYNYQYIVKYKDKKLKKIVKSVSLCGITSFGAVTGAGVGLIENSNLSALANMYKGMTREEAKKVNNAIFNVLTNPSNEWENNTYEENIYTNILNDFNDPKHYSFDESLWADHTVLLDKNKGFPKTFVKILSFDFDLKTNTDILFGDENEVEPPKNKSAARGDWQSFYSLLFSDRFSATLVDSAGKKYYFSPQEKLPRYTHWGYPGERRRFLFFSASPYWLEKGLYEAYNPNQKILYNISFDYFNSARLTTKLEY